MNRRQVLTAAFASLTVPFHFWELAAAPVRHLAATSETGTQVETLFRKDLPDLARGDNTASLSVLRVLYAPGGESRSHTHPVPAFVYVLRGVVESQVEGEMTRRYGAGEYFFEEAGHRHLLARNASSTESAEFLTIFVGKANLPLTIPVSDQNRTPR